MSSSVTAVLEERSTNHQEVSEEVVAIPEGAATKPFSAFGSYRQRHGDVENINFKAGMSSEAPAILGSVAGGGTDLVQGGAHGSKSAPVNIPRSSGSGGGSKDPGMRRRVLRPRNREVELDEAWERKRDQHLLEEMKQATENRQARAVGRSVSDCGERPLPRLDSTARAADKTRFRARSLTDEDLDELRGSIDLGFGFSNQADPRLWNTLPALELCYAINQQYQNKGSPVSTVDDDGTGSDGTGSPMNSPSWTVSSPGDHPQQVKTRIRHWAQAVACTIRQNYKHESS
ncbi:hypothetical protein SELMODRAFT_437629 [Selaginella moellendorffii]|uniref:Uncharacterized protein n=1 Tax=Selaginella moellendorffii TaxID=88036 RepID=D8QNH8_SELML|nr:uncharacterized protein LOC9632734 [Selaginella moellendorffii]XP_002969205.1 uncharacterized protein LOC9659204 [Selaginella moellendorffii]EFJ29293.1 hypothetical protein SELMODRAFT_440689 [Selaginella moellendorffii]EFJ38103.1 hypothetical protein SELMODRAFT_437629 [Selaginella moellendorffii]|eukprot:XP_002960564.1 uncharacterized protein LOC9632734 [Selaginella moellendorffii]